MQYQYDEPVSNYPTCPSCGAENSMGRRKRRAPICRQCRYIGRQPMEHLYISIETELIRNGWDRVGVQWSYKGEEPVDLDTAIHQEEQHQRNRSQEFENILKEFQEGQK